MTALVRMIREKLERGCSCRLVQHTIGISRIVCEFCHEAPRLLSQAADEIVKCQMEIQALRKLNTAYRIGHNELADVALTELEALEETP